MRYLKQQTGKSRLPGFVAAAVLTIAILAAGPISSTLRAEDFKPNLYVPYEDLVHLIAPADKAVLMDRREFETLLADAEARAALTDTLELGQVKLAE
ncbi:MAG: hypothetical protein ACYS8Z_08650, partial [Planctomycetota bacterium]